MNQIKEISERMGRSITLKLLIIGILILIMLIPVNMVRNLITERKATSEEVINEVSNSWGNEQTVTGPFITIPYKTYYKVGKEVKETTNYAHFLPEQLNYKGEVIPEIRKRGIYKVVVYESKMEIKGDFTVPDFSFAGVNPNDVMWNHATINMGITDMRGIQEGITVSCENKNYELNPGIATKDLVTTGVSTLIKINRESPMNFQIKLNLNGSKKLNFVPLGKETEVSMNSTWPHPSFSGEFLPRNHKITEKGFQASWKVLHLNRSFPQQWTDHAFDVMNSVFGVSLIIPVDHYQKSTRSIKYAIMFIALTFITFFFIEVINRKRIHTIHYLLVGFALVIFYSLLISMSEHIPFNIAYLVSSVAVIALITAFGAGLFKNKKQTLTLLMVLIVLYIFLFTILQLMDYALLMGNIGLFIVLAIVMYFTRKIKWNSNDNM